jgi:hypothetical protein
MSETTVTQRARLEEIELTDVIAFGPDVRVYCTQLGLWTFGGRVASCGHFRQMEDCRYCYESGTEHKPCKGCKQ